MSEDIKIGSRVWRRTGYRSHGSTRKDWEERVVLGETRVSWIIGPVGATLEDWRCEKLKKRGDSSRNREHYAFSEHEIERNVWLGEHRWKIQQALGMVQGFDKIAAVARIIEYEPAPPAKGDGAK